ncbi:hypothetical protein DFH11DRAFT_1646204 [Phellopilus nigrolimitatus]|nr:hypothetical protein DFH11DRAFT_1646204 [Phellopilus nigrolimitatus]
MPSPFSSSSSSSLLPSSPPVTTPSLTLRSSYSSSTSSFATSAPQRDLFSTFGTLASTYGANASAFIPVHAIPGGVVSTSRRARKSLKERLRLLVPNSLMPSPAPTRVALPQSPPPSESAAKDYEGAFGALQSTYGLCATAPVIGNSSQRKA